MTTPATLTDLPRVHRALLLQLAGGAVETVTPTEDALAHTLTVWGLAEKVGLCEWEITGKGREMVEGEMVNGLTTASA